MKSGYLLIALAILGVAGCGGPAAEPNSAQANLPNAGAAGSLAWAVAGDWRLDKEKARDQWRHPVETLTFFGVKPSDTVVEIAPGGGWYTAILGPWLREGGGRLYSAHVDPAASDGARAQVDNYKAAFVDHPEKYGDITLTVGSRTSLGIAPDGVADAVLTFRNIHNWMGGGYADKILTDAFRALKPGGVLGVVEHRMPSAREQDLRAPTGYVLESYVVQLAQNAGFVFEASSEINANPKDTADHPLGVWMLPPNMRAPAAGTPEAEGYDPAAYTSVGESDRMTLRFRKPVDTSPPSAAPVSAEPTPTDTPPT